MLRAGGTAADAAIAASAVLAVTAPHMCGMGGDLFALVHDPAAPHQPPATLNASGRAGSGADPARLRAEGSPAMPFRDDVRSAPVPGCVDGWVQLHDRFGALAFDDVLAPAIAYAAAGFPASPTLALTCGQLIGVRGAEALVPGERRPRSGQRLVRPGVARTLEAIAREGRRGFYEGEFGRGLLELGAGEYIEADLGRVLADWVELLGIDVWGHRVWTTPPNSQGYLTLLGAAMAAGLHLPERPEDGAWAHLLVEAARAAAHDRPAFLHEHADAGPLLAAPAVAARRDRIDAEHRSPLALPVGAGDTMFLCAVDADRMGVSLIQSNCSGFGNFVFEPSTGIGLHNRGIGFSLQAGHPAEYGPGRRPPHTLAPAMVTHPDGSLRACVGTMGGDAQPQVLLQLLTRYLHHGGSPGAVIGAPRFALTGSAASGFDTWNDPDGVRVEVEAAAGEEWVQGLSQRGHEVKVVDGVVGTFGHAHLIEVTPDGMLGGAADPRALTGAASGF